jgi:hypothetical protein
MLGYKKGIGREYGTKDGRMTNVEVIMEWTKMIFLLLFIVLCNIYCTREKD